MMRCFSRKLLLSVGLAAGMFCGMNEAPACTNILVGRGASQDGSIFVSYSIDGPGTGTLSFSLGRPKGDPKAADPVEAEWTGPTYNVVGYMNEHQLAIGETTTDGRKELRNHKVGLHYFRLMTLALARCKTAREAIAEIARLMDKFGYSSEGETLSIGDKNEVWMMEIIGKGPDRKGAVWVAARVPDDCLTVHANMSRITTFPLDDPKNWLYSPDVIDFAIEKGFFDPKGGKPFSFRDVYHPQINQFIRKVCAGRVWSAYRRSAPSQNFSDAYFRSTPGAEDYPLFIKPDKKVSVHDVMQLFRDHFEGTPYDMTKGIDAGPFGSPYRWRGLTFKVGSKDYSWERPLSTQQAACVWVSQSRNWLPDPVGGVFWFSSDDSYTSCFTPFYCGVTRVPESYQNARLEQFSWDKAWWIFNLVSNLTYSRYSRILPEVQTVQRDHEAKFLKMQPIIEETAVKLAAADEKLMRDYLTNYSNSTADGLLREWQQLASGIIAKHNDGYVFTSGKGPEGVGYPEEWLKRVIQERPKPYEIDAPPEH